MEIQNVKYYSRADRIKRWVPSIIIAALGAYFILNRGDYTLIDNADLVIHEAGHFFFIFFGRFIYTAGGTLMQIILPSFITWYFFSQSYRAGMQFSLFWLGQNLINISVYAADARARELPLLGGNNVYHDWYYLLSQMDILKYDQYVGYFFYGLSIIVILVAVILPLILRD